MESKSSNQESTRYIKQNIRAAARKERLTMSSKNGKNSTVLQLEDGKFQLVPPSECDDSYTDQVLKLLDLAYPKSIKVKELKGMTTYQNITQFRTSVIQKLHDQGLVYFDSDPEEVLISPLGRLYVHDRRTIIFQNYLARLVAGVSLRNCVLV